MNPDLPRLDTRYAVLRTGPRSSAVIELVSSHRIGDGPYIGTYRIIERFTDPDYPMVPAMRASERLASEALCTHDIGGDCPHYS